MNDSPPPKTKRRWYHLTPDRLLVALLPFLGFLLLSVRFRWFPFNEHKNWAVAIAVAVVGVAIMLLLLWLGVSLVFRRQFQSSIRALLVLVTAVAVMCSSFSTKMQQARRQMTPDRLLVALLPTVGFLWLSERFLWFPFNEHKNWTVLIAVTVVCVAVALLFLWFGVSPFQFSIRSLLVLVTVVAILCSWFSVKLQQARRQREVVEAIDKRGSIGYTAPLLPFRFPDSVDPSWLRNMLGVDFLFDVKDVNCGHAGLVHLEALPSLERLVLVGTQVTDADLLHLKGLTSLRGLRLHNTQVTDAGLKHLKGLTSLQWLYLDGSSITGVGLVHLKGLTNLQYLYLSDTSLTDAGLVHLKRLTNLEVLSLRSTEVTDAGLEHLKGLTSLTSLFLESTRVTDAGLMHLKGLMSLYRLDLTGTQVTDAGLAHLKGLISLHWLDLADTQVTDAGVHDLQQALLNWCEIYYANNPRQPREDIE